jgi:hypothetical protein
VGGRSVDFDYPLCLGGAELRTSSVVLGPVSAGADSADSFRAFNSKKHPATKERSHG